MTNKALTSSAVFSQLKSAFLKNRLGHALLFIESGKSESFKKERYNFFQTLSCRESKKTSSGLEACGNCESCKLYLSQKDLTPPPHPDLFCLQPEGDFAYGVDQIRQLGERMSLARSLSPYRIVHVEDAEALSGGSAAAANAFLKILEEPRPFTFIILSTTKPANLLLTLRSRCQSFRFSSTLDSMEESLERIKEWGFEELLEWLKKGAPSSLGYHCPMDNESFWKKRSESLELVQKTPDLLWNLMKDSFPALGSQEQVCILDFFSRFDRFLGRLRFHTQAHLQWLETKFAQ